jgi:transcriptional regulator with XRE-family HTH domain
MHTAMPADMWDRPALVDALDRHDIGDVLANVIKYSGLSQHAVAALTGVPQGRVSQYIRHQITPTLDTAVRIADGLAMPYAARRRLGLGTSDQAQAERPVKLSMVLAAAENIGRSGDGASLAAWRNLDNPASQTEAWHCLARTLDADHSDTPVAERMAARTRGFYLVAARMPARLVIRSLTAHVREVTLLLDTVHEREARRVLTVIGGESSYLAACCQADLGEFGETLELLDTIELAARKAADSALAAMALDGRSHFQAMRAHHGRALELIRRGREACPPTISQGTAAYMWLRAAEEHVNLRQVDEATAAWEHAEALFAGVHHDADRNWVNLWLGRDCFESVRAVIYASTGRREESAEIAEQVVMRLAGTDGKSDAISLTNAAIALARCGAIAAAAGAAQDALQAIRQSEARTCLGRLRTLTTAVDQDALSTEHMRSFLRDVSETERYLAALLKATGLGATRKDDDQDQRGENGRSGTASDPRRRRPDMWKSVSTRRP